MQPNNFSKKSKKFNKKKSKIQQNHLRPAVAAATTVVVITKQPLQELSWWSATIGATYKHSSLAVSLRSLGVVPHIPHADTFNALAWRNCLRSPSCSCKNFCAARCYAVEPLTLFLVIKKFASFFVVYWVLSFMALWSVASFWLWLRPQLWILRLYKEIDLPY